ncbi:MAG TPA: hypothetical protein VFS20_25070 [Longimicrobium sp.]|nr:hypothetical protein [Longimicrobium sp.]
MKKLKLVVDDLQVQSFETDRGLPRGGTVRGFDSGKSDPMESGVYCGNTGMPGAQLQAHLLLL